MNQSTIISYAGVKEASNTILSCSKTMENIFEDFSKEMNSVRADDVFTGDASTSLGGRFDTLKTKFSGYVAKIKEFSDAIDKASTSTAETESKLASEADSLAG